MQTFQFSLLAVAALLEEAHAATEHKMICFTQRRPGLLLVHDDGVYLLSTAKDSQLAPVFAEGWGKGTHMGGDDWVEFFDVDLRGIKKEEGDQIILKRIHDRMKAKTTIQLEVAPKVYFRNLGVKR